MKERENIDKWSLFYRFLQLFIVGPLYRYYFRKIEVKNIQKVPKNQSVILAPNHQNALMDALVFVGNTNFQTVFLARADVFKSSKLIVRILTFIKILPVYRIRDGRSELQKNDEIFELTEKILKNKNSPLCLFPEGNHGNRRRLRPLVKGIFRIAFRAQEQYTTGQGIKIVPVGIDYGHYWKFRHTLFLNFGDPIDVCEYWEDYGENPSVAINKLRERLAAEMKKVMINIETEEYYGLYMTLRKMCRKLICTEKKLNYRNLADQFQADKELIRKLDICLEKDPERMARLNNDYVHYKELRDSLQYRDWVPERKRYPVLINILGILLSTSLFPLVALGLFNNWPNLMLPRLFTKKIKDVQFHSTAIWGGGFALTLVYYSILFALALIFIPFWWLKLMYIIILPGSGIFVFSYRNFLIKSWARIRYSFPWGKRAGQNKELRKAYEKLIMNTTNILEEYQ